MELIQGICYLMAVMLGLYSALILIRIIVSWILFFNRRNQWRSGNAGFDSGQQSFSKVLSSADSFLGKICDPYLKLFSGVSSLKRSHLDLTPLLALLVLNLVRSLLSAIAETESFSAALILAVLIDVAWRSVGSFLLFLLIVLLIIRCFLGRSLSPEAANWINNTLDPILDSPVSFVYRVFFRGKKVDDQKIVIASIIFYLIVLIGSGLAVNFLCGLLMNI